MSEIYDNQKYLDLLYDAGQALEHIETFINCLVEADIVPKSKLEATQDYLRRQLLTDKATKVINAYRQEVKKTDNYLKNNPLSDKEADEILDMLKDEFS